MVEFIVGPVPAFKEDVLNGYRSLRKDCALGFMAVTRLLKTAPLNERTDRCGRLDDRFEVFAVPLLSCPARAMVVSFEAPTTTGHRWLHGSLLIGKRLKDRAGHLAAHHHGLINPTWEAQ